MASRSIASILAAAAARSGSVGMLRMCERMSVDLSMPSAELNLLLDLFTVVLLDRCLPHFSEHVMLREAGLLSSGVGWMGGLTIVSRRRRILFPSAAARMIV